MRPSKGFVNRVIEIYLAGAIDKRSGERAKMTAVDEYTRKLIQADRRRQAIKLMAKKHPIHAVAARFSISRSRVYRIVNGK